MTDQKDKKWGRKNINYELRKWYDPLVLIYALWNLTVLQNKLTS